MGEHRTSAPIETLRRRAELLARTRRFFADRGVLEVETPVLASGVIVERHIDPPTCSLDGAARFLLASPESAMKRLLACGAGAIYQITRAFREGELGRLHNPEFTILEWYRPGLGLAALMDEVEELFVELMGAEVPKGTADRSSYREVFLENLGVDPLESTVGDLEAAARERNVETPPGFDRRERDAWLDLLLSLCVQPQLGQERPVFVHDYPASQAALARLSPEDDRVAERFELFYRGVELSNGYHELLDADEQRGRLEEANRQRLEEGRAALPIDERFLDALESGLPECSGVAVGFDRVVMLACRASSLAEVLAFPFDRV